jgi:antitoxin VapB
VNGRVDGIIGGTYIATLPCMSNDVFMKKSKVLKRSGTQAVRLPKALAFPADLKFVDVTGMGRTRIISPAGESWDSWFNGPGVTNDFMPDRDQPEPQERESF